MKRVLSIIDGISDWSGKIFSFLILAAMAVVVVEVVRRYVFNAPTVYALPVTIFICAATYLLSGAYALLDDAHVRIDVFYSRWSPRVRGIMDLITAPVFFIGVGVMFWVGSEWTIKAIVLGTGWSGAWLVPIWPVRLFIPVASALLIIQGVAKAIRDFNAVRTGMETAREKRAA